MDEHERSFRFGAASQRELHNKVSLILQRLTMMRHSERRVRQNVQGAMWHDASGLFTSVDPDSGTPNEFKLYNASNPELSMASVDRVRSGNFSSSCLLQDTDRPGRFCLHWFRLVTPKDVRGKPFMLYPRLLEVGFEFDDGAHWMKGWFGTDDCVRWICLGCQDRQGMYWGWRGASLNDFSINDDEPDVSLRNSYSFALSFLMMPEREWTVTIGKGVSVTLSADSLAAREMFRWRDKPKDRKRRASIHNWVREHQRRLRDGRVVPVAAHLRGATEFEWLGLPVRIEPSEWAKRCNASGGFQPSPGSREVLEAAMELDPRAKAYASMMRFRQMKAAALEKFGRDARDARALQKRIRRTRLHHFEARPGWSAEISERRFR